MRAQGLRYGESTKERIRRVLWGMLATERMITWKGILCEDLHVVHGVRYIRVVRSKRIGS
jgi:hypothetical protein